jgi:hypothetical protein
MIKLETVEHRLAAVPLAVETASTNKHKTTAVSTYTHTQICTNNCNTPFPFPNLNDVLLRPPANLARVELSRAVAYPDPAVTGFRLYE